MESAPEIKPDNVATLNETANEALKPEPKKYTEAEIRKLRSKYWTVRYGTVNACGHKFQPVYPPRTNCYDCWEAYFRVHDNVVKSIHDIIEKFGVDQLKKTVGTKYYKFYLWFESLIEEETKDDRTATTSGEPLNEVNEQGEATASEAGSSVQELG